MRDLPAKSRFRVFLNYPFDDDFYQNSVALHFAVTAANLIPVCARDIGTPDQLRLAMLAELVSDCDLDGLNAARVRRRSRRRTRRLAPSRSSSRSDVFQRFFRHRASQVIESSRVGSENAM
jgi:hypothetical protein